MFRPGKILQFGGASNTAVVIDITSGTPVVTPTARDVVPAAHRHRDDPSRRHGARDRRQRGLQRTHRRQLTRRDLEPRHRPMDRRRRGRIAAAVPLQRHPAARRQRPGRRRRRARPDDQRQRGDLLPAVPVHGRGVAWRRDRGSSRRPTCCRWARSFTIDFANATGIRARRAGQDRFGHAQLRHGPTLVPLSFTVSGNRVTTQVPTAATTVPPGLLPAVPDQQRGDAVGRER